MRWAGARMPDAAKKMLSYKFLVGQRLGEVGDQFRRKGE